MSALFKAEIAARAEDLYEKEYKDKFLGKWDDKSI